MRGALRHVVHFAASVLIVTGLLLVIDAALTVLWQEPVSAFVASRDQGKLSGQLDRLKLQFRGLERSAPSAAQQRRELRRLARLARGRAETGHAIGKIELPTLGRHYVMVQGTDTASLRKGPGHYPETAFPGEGRTVAVAGHRTTYLAPFRTVDQLKKDDRIVLEMPYGTFTYKVERTKVVPPTALWVTKNVGYDRLVLSACHPLYSASHRIVVFARLASEKLS